MVAEDAVAAAAWRVRPSRVTCASSPLRLRTCAGPVVGLRSDSYLLDRSDFEKRMARAQARTGRMFRMYGDAAYARTPQVMRAIKGTTLTPQQAQLNAAMNSLRVSIEWGFGAIAQQFAYVTYSKGLTQLYKQPVNMLHVQRACTCVATGATPHRDFGVRVPTMEACLCAA